LAPYIDMGSPLSRTSKNAKMEIANNNGTASSPRRIM
jgi:hypothetical protein